MKKGFTIVELLIVVVVIAILAAITIVAYNGISQRSRVSALQSELSQAGKALEAKKITSSETYPASLSDVGVSSTKLTYHYNSRANTFCIDGKDGSIEYSVRGGALSPSEGLCVQQDLAVWLPFNGTVEDISGRNVAVSINGSPTVTTGANSQANGAYALDGSSQSFTITGADTIPTRLDAFTVSVWARGINSSLDYGTIVHRGVNTSIGPSVYWVGTQTGSNQYIITAVNGVHASGASTVSSSIPTWRHIVLVYAGGYQTGYVDGAQTISTSVPSITNVTTGTTLTVGAGASTFRPFNGAVDDLRIYNRALSASEVTALYAAGAR